MAIHRYHFTDPKRPALIHFDRPLKPVTITREIELRAMQGLVRWQQTKEETNNPSLKLCYFFSQMGYTLQEYNRAFWLNEKQEQEQ